MRQLHVDDPWARQLLLCSEARLAEARAFTAIRAAVRGPGRPRAARPWLRALRTLVGRWLLQPLLGPATPE